MGGCDEIQSELRKLWLAGTLRGYKNCVEQNKDLGVRTGLVQKMCRSQFTVRINPPIEGGAGYEISKYGMLTFNGWIKNRSKKFVITSLVLYVSHVDNIDDKGNPIKERMVANDLWIEPAQRKAFKIGDFRFKPKEDRIMRKKEGKFLHTWEIATIKGLEISLK